jgi:peptide/nickel transport system substrate-binding protein
LILAAGACGGDDEPERRADEFPRGGTLRVAIGFFSEPGQFPLDPQRFSAATGDLHRCCLLRTLLSYRGQPTEAGGAVLRPDLATALPRVSADGLTWTFRLKGGIRYAPPFDDREIVAADVIRALERALTARTSDYVGFYQLIEGARAYAAGHADSISGLEAPDQTTLVVHLTRPWGTLGANMALSAAAPIPPGAAEGHRDYGRFLVASGPYMIEGSEKLDFSLPPGRQKPVSGFRPRRSLTLVRNPSWDPSSDPLRPAYVDRIEITVAADLDAQMPEVEAGRLDFVLEAGSPPTYVRRFRRSAELRTRLHEIPRDITWATWMNLAVPPFDDVNVRKAVNLVLDKDRLRNLIFRRPVFGRWLRGEVTGHLVPDSLQNNLLLDYDPYVTPGHRGDVKAARAEMAKSRYDRNRDGLCDHQACRSVRGIAFREGPIPAMAAAVGQDLRKLGIRVDVETIPPQTFGTEAFDPAKKVPLILVTPWQKDQGGASSFFEATFHSEGIATGGNFPLVGAGRDQLRRWKYPVRSVPNVDAKVEECGARAGAAAFECWAEADQLLMERVVPWAPFFSAAQTRLVSARIAHFSFAQSTTLPALDQIALKKGSG